MWERLRERYGLLSRTQASANGETCAAMSLILACCSVGSPMKLLTRYVAFLIMCAPRVVVEEVERSDSDTTWHA